MPANPVRAVRDYLRGADIPNGPALPGSPPTVDMRTGVPRPTAKAAALATPTRQAQGFWLGDPVAGGAWVDTGSGGRWGAGWRDGATFDYRRAMGDGLGNSILVGCLRAISEAVGEPPPRLYALDAKDERKATKEPAGLLKLLRRPNPFMTWERLAIHIAVSQHLAGAAYLWCARSGSGRLVELWPLPPDPRVVWPVEGPDTRRWITGFGYHPKDAEQPTVLPPEDVVYLPFGANVYRPRAPISPLASLWKHLFTDEEASDFTASVLRNFGVPGVVLSPEPSAAADGGGPDASEREQIKQTYKQKFGGSQRGEPMVMREPMRVNVVSYSPEQMRLDRLQMLPETRVCSVMGVPPIVALLLSGHENATYSNSRQLREHFVESKMVPYWRLLESDLTWRLMPEFGADPEKTVIALDLQDVRALQEDQDAKYKRMTDLAARGLATVNQVQQELGLPGFGADGEVLLIPTTSTPTAPADLLAPPEPTPVPAPVPLALPGAAGENGQPGDRASIRELPPPEQRQAQGQQQRRRA